ncbi:hypothetical protein GCM10011360_24440 [Primorskyibacter flagellatus]|uniref:Uncharacterized protein n=1 Tax=Primorskyibacter flagellatus TaxID=1387277 RepID=A0A917A8X9_9RHOB|nr:hypothetical protein GCM10011360_24440 [Primorskyibacter flagellatus]
MLHEGGQGHREGPGKFGDGEGACGQPLQDRPSGRIPEGEKDVIEIGLMFSHIPNYSGGAESRKQKVRLFPN